MSSPTFFERKEIRSTETADWRLDPRRYSSWFYLVGVYARVQRVANNMQKAKKRVGRELLPQERRDAEYKKTILFTQYNEKVTKQLLAAKKQVTQKSMLAKWNPHLDYQGMIHSDSRLRFAEYLPYDPDFP